MRKRTEHDDTIDTVLAGLRDVAPAPGMNRRILAGARKRASAESHAPWHWLRFAGWPRPVAVRVFAGVAVMAMVAVALFMSSSRPVEPLPSLAKQDAALPAAGSRPVASAPASPSALSSVASHSMRPRLVRAVKRGGGQDRAGNRQLLSVSYPAPPMPLTEQEKLLLRVVHRRDPVEMAMLNPEARSRQEAEDRDNFQRFFDTSTVKKN